MKFMHISDLHFYTLQDKKNIETLTLQDEKDIKIPREKLIEFINDKKIEVEHLFITGDFRHAKYQKENEQRTLKKIVKFIWRIAKKVGINNASNIHIVPGNHDVTRYQYNENRKQYFKINKIVKSYEFSNGKFSIDDVPFLLERCKFFYMVAEELYGIDSLWDKDNTIHKFQTFGDFNIIYLNTAITNNKDSDDKGNLRVGSTDVHKYLEISRKDNPKKPIIILAHNSIIDFCKKDREAYETFFRDYPIKLYLCGDIHETWHRSINRNTLEITMGCLKYERDAEIAFAVGELGLEVRDVKAFAWSQRYNNWSECASFNESINRLIAKNKFSATIITKNKPVPPSQFFKKRNKEIKIIEKRLQGDNAVALLSGVGGIGKTELCRKIFYDYIKKSNIGIDKIGWITYKNSLADSFFCQFINVDAASLNCNEYFELIKKKIKSWGNTLLLIIDNVNVISNKEINILLKLDCKLIITSRLYKMERIKPIVIGMLPIKDCIKLYREHSEDYISSEEIIKKIIKKTNGHTLAVELLAKTQLSGVRTAGELLTLLENEGFKLPTIKEPVFYNHNIEFNSDDESEKHFIRQFSKIFDISKIKKTEIIKTLSLWSVLSCEPIDGKTYKTWFGAEGFSEVTELVNSGWINHYQKKTEVSFYIHPIILSVLNYKLKPSYEICNDLVINICDSLKVEEGEVFTKSLSKLSHGIYVSNYFQDIDDLSLAMLDHNIGVLKYYLGNYNESIKYYKKDLDRSIRLLGEKNLDISTTYSDLGLVYYTKGEYKKALKNYKIALDIINEDVSSEKNQNAVIVYTNIAMVYDECEKHKKALKYYEKALNIIKEINLKDHFAVAAIYGNMASSYYTQGKYKEALKYNKKTLQVRRKILSKRHPDIAVTYSNIALVYSAQAKYDLAMEYLVNSLNITLDVYGEKHIETSVAYDNLATIYLAKGNFKRALEYHNNALSIIIECFGDKHPALYYIYYNIASVYFELGRYDNALKHYKKALENIFDGTQLKLANIYNNIGLLYFEQRKFKLALRYYKRSLNILEIIKHPNVASVYNNIAMLYCELGKYEKAFEYCAKDFNITTKLLGRKHPDIANSYSVLTMIFYAKGEYNRALYFCKKDLKITKMLGEEHPELAMTYDNLGGIYSMKKSFKNALTYYKKALCIRTKTFGYDHPDVATSYYNLALVLRKTENIKRAIYYCKKALDIKKRKLGKNHPDTEVVKKYLDGLLK